MKDGLLDEKKRLVEFWGRRQKKSAENLDGTAFVVSSDGFEPSAYRLGGGRSIQLSYEDRCNFKGKMDSNGLPLRRRSLYPAELRRRMRAAKAAQN